MAAARNTAADTNQSGSYVSSRTAQSTDMTTPHTEAVTPARRVVVIRNTKNPHSAQGHVDLSELGRSNSDENPAVTTDGNKLVYVMRRPIGSKSSSRPPPPAELHQTVPESINTTQLQHARTLTPPNETAISFDDQPRSPSPHHSPSIRPKHHTLITTSPIQTEKSSSYIPYLRRPRSKVRTPSPPPIRTTSYKRSTSPTQAEHYQGVVPYLRRSRSKVRTPSPPPIRTTSSKRSVSPSQTENYQESIPYLRSSKSKIRAPTPIVEHTNSARSPTVNEDKIDDIDPQQTFTYYSLQNINESMNTSSPVMVENEEHTTQNYNVQNKKDTQRTTAASSAVKSAKSIVLINPDDQSIAVVENSYTKGAKSVKIARFIERDDDRSSESLLKRSPRRGCLGCLARHMCLIILICFILIFIGLAGAGVSAYFYVLNSTDNFIPTIAGMAAGGALALAALLFLCIVVACIGSHDGYFNYNDDEKQVGGRAFAFIPPTHPNAHLYIPRDYAKLVENGNQLPMAPMPARASSNFVYGHQSLMAPVSTVSYTPQQAMNRSNRSTITVNNKSNNDIITIEMPERLVTGREMSPKSRERNLNQVVKNIGHVVEDSKKKNNGDAPKKVIIQIEKNKK
ncbi:unnamed protein product [Rotaria socialis]|uniref:Uncharacterized protein n=1 Tax=Rotaria socialis TaxID=392032 RepID=A0A818DDS0_9BILA|nr:unnamed protein product [Rotaria socialis]CAF3333217.1 unnamed protein product [Rotaria socialis]CAF3445850.1 unnamed protein product [Rotaria socialis]CAF3533281.1 unnamed protein product [Rotaria socialis]